MEYKRRETLACIGTPEAPHERVEWLAQSRYRDMSKGDYTIMLRPEDARCWHCDHVTTTRAVGYATTIGVDTDDENT